MILICSFHPKIRKKKWRKKTIPQKTFGKVTHLEPKKTLNSGNLKQHVTVGRAFYPIKGGGASLRFRRVFFLSWPHFVQRFFKVTERDIVDV